MLTKADLFQYFLSPIDLSMAILYLLIIIIIGIIISHNQKTEYLKKHYRYNLTFKLLFASIFLVYYVIVIGGGDTTAYWQTTGVLKNYLFVDPSHFLEMMRAEPSYENFIGYFNYRTGYPFRFIYMEPESFFVSKLLLPLRIITFDSYIATTFIMAFWMAHVNWKLFLAIKGLNIIHSKYLTAFLLYIPSVSFWAAGISKDTFTLICIFAIIRQIILLLNKNSVFSVKNVFWMCLYAFFIYKLRPFLLPVVFVPLILIYIQHFIKRLEGYKLLQQLIKLFTFLTFILGAYLGFNRYMNEDYLSSSTALSSALVIQQDFENNTEIYGDEQGKRYSIHLEDTSPLSLIKALPTAIIAGMYRPFIWEALRPSLILNGIESLLFIVFTFSFFSSGVKEKIRIILSHPFLVFALLFVIFMAFITGFTSILFGVLVRLRAPLLPFFGMLLLVKPKDEYTED